MDDRTRQKLHAALDRYRDGAPANARSYPDLHEHVLALARDNLLVVVDEPINKDTEMHPLVRWQYRGGIPEPERKAFLFTQPTDSKGRRYDGAVLVAGLAANRAVYRTGFGKPLEDIGAAWVDAIANPIPPRVVEYAPCQEIVIAGKDLDRDGQALDGLPVPISTPGWDNAPYLSAGHYITKDPDSGVQNVGNYRGQLKAPRRLGMNPSVELRAGIYAHWEKCKARGQPLPCAVVVGCPPVVSYASVQKLASDLDELAVAGAIAGGPINVVRCKTIDLMVPAEAEIVIEGLINTELLEPEAPFGESHGYVNLQEYNAFMDVTAITRRRHPILTSFISQVTPSESSVIRRVAMEPVLQHYLKSVLSIRGVRRVAMHEPLTSLYAVIAIQFARGTPESEIWRALHGAASLHRFAGKWIVAVDEDIEPENADALLWAMSYRCQPHYDLKLVPHKDPGHGPRGPHDGGETAAVLINATLKGTFAPVALPKREFMENARAIWERLGLPPLTPQPPWHGYDLGHWPQELARQAKLATDSDYFSLGQAMSNERARRRGHERAGQARRRPAGLAPPFCPRSAPPLLKITAAIALARRDLSGDSKNCIQFNDLQLRPCGCGDWHDLCDSPPEMPLFQHRELSMKRRDFLKSVGAVAAGSAVTAPAIFSPAKAQARQETLLIVSESGPNNIDIHGVGTNVPGYEVSWNCYDRLISHEMKTVNGTPYYDRDRFKMELAEDMNVGDMSVTFKLKKNATFHDGTPVTANDVKWSLDRAVSVGGFPTFQMGAGSLTKREQFVVVDNNTVRVDFLKKDRLTIPDLAVIVPCILNSGLVKKHATAKDPWGLEYTKQHTAGSGAYRVVKWSAGTEVVMERFDKWAGGPQPKVRRVIWRIVPSSGNRRALIERGDADISYDLPNKDFSELRNNPKLTIISTPYSNGIQYIGMNVTKPPFDNPKVRQAVAYAIPYQKIMDAVLFGLSKPMFGAPAGTKTEVAWPQPHQFTTDIAKAKKLMAEAGYPNGFETTLSFDLGFAGVNEPLCVLTQESLAQIGIKCTINKIPGATWRTELNKKVLPLYTNVFSGWLDYPEYFFIWCYHGKNSIFNTMSYQSPKLDSMIDAAVDAAAIKDAAKYETNVRGFVDLAFADMPRIPIFQPYVNVAMQKNVSGYQYWFHRRLDYRSFVKG